MPRTFPDTVEVHNVADARFDTSRGDQSATLILKASGEADFLIEQDGETWPGTVPAPPGWGTNPVGVDRYVVYAINGDGNVRSLVLELDAGEKLLRIERDWHHEANPTG